MVIRSITVTLNASNKVHISLSPKIVKKETRDDFSIGRSSVSPGSRVKVHVVIANGGHGRVSSVSTMEHVAQ